MKRESAVSKECRCCHRVKLLSEFVTNKTGRDGTENRCRECQKKARAIYYATHREQEIMNARLYQGIHGERLASKRREWQRKRAHHFYETYLKPWHKKNKDRKAAYSLKYRTAYPDKVRAQTILNAAIRNHKVARPSICEECGSGERIEGHHPDYSKPLEVVWLCHGCHNKRNRKYA